MKAYHNFVLSLAPHEEESGGEWLKAWVIDSPTGEMRLSEAAKVEFPARLRSRLKALEQRQLDLEGLISLGEELAGLLLPPPVRDLYRRSLERIGAQEGLRLQIRADSPELGALPWEYAYVGDPDTPAERKGHDGFLALDRRISMVRYEALEDSPKIDPVPPGSLRLAILFANVRDPAYPALDLAQEEVNLRQALEGVKGVEPSYLRPGTREKLADLLNTKGAQIFHFSGHGEFPMELSEKPGVFEGHGRLILAGDDGRPDPWDASKLATYLRGLGVRLAVLGACEAAQRDQVTPWSSVATALVRGKIPAVVGMQFTIRDGNAVEFSRGLYQGLASGQSIDAAVSKGRMEIFNRSGGSERDWGVPVLYLREQDSNLQLFPKDMRPVSRNAFLAVLLFAFLGVWFVFHVLPLAERLRDAAFGKVGLPVSAGLLMVWLLSQVYTQFKSALWSWNGLPIMDWMHSIHTRNVLFCAVVMAALLLATTSSVYLDYPAEGFSHEKVEVNLKVKKTGDSLEPLVATTEKKTAGRPIFFNLLMPELEPTVAFPEDGWDVLVNNEVVKSFRLLPIRWRLTVIPSKLRMIRLLPSAAMLEKLDTTSSKQFFVTVTIGADEVNVNFLGLQTIYIGPEDVQGLYGEQSKVTRVKMLENAFRDELNECYPVRRDSHVIRGDWQETWENESFSKLKTIQQLEDGQEVIVEVKSRDTGEETEEVKTRTVKLSGVREGYYTICLDWNETEP